MKKPELGEVAKEIKNIWEGEYKRFKVSKLIENRIKEFEILGQFGKTHYDFNPFLNISFTADIFSELCFCILTANSSAELGIRLQQKIGDGFKTWSFEELSKNIREMGHRYPEIRARYIILARDFDINFNGMDGKSAREKVMKVKGIGLKEGSHFLRNIGFHDVAIIDRHIYRFLVERNLVEFEETITPKIYFKAEKVLEEISKIVGLPLSYIDLIIFFKKTGKILK